jgi:diketogulonate reductase-like aldo/keto reductase
MQEAEVMPMVNQVEFHPLLVQNELREFCMANGIQLEAWSDLQMGVVTIPKSANPSRMKENADIFDFEISSEDVMKIK